MNKTHNSATHPDSVSHQFVFLFLFLYFFFFFCTNLPASESWLLKEEEVKVCLKDTPPPPSRLMIADRLLHADQTQAFIARRLFFLLIPTIITPTWQETPGGGKPLAGEEEATGIIKAVMDAANHGGYQTWYLSMWACVSSSSPAVPLLSAEDDPEFKGEKKPLSGDSSRWRDERRCKQPRECRCPSLFTDPPFVLNTCGLCGFKTSSPLACLKSKPGPTRGQERRKKKEKRKELKHDSLLLPSPWALGILPFTQGYSVWASVRAGLESVRPPAAPQPGHKYRPAVFTVDWQLMWVLQRMWHRGADSVPFFPFFFFLFYFTCNIVYTCWQSRLVRPRFNNLSPPALGWSLWKILLEMSPGLTGSTS